MPACQVKIPVCRERLRPLGRGCYLISAPAEFIPLSQPLNGVVDMSDTVAPPVDPQDTVPHGPGGPLAQVPVNPQDTVSHGPGGPLDTPPPKT